MLIPLLTCVGSSQSTGLSEIFSALPIGLIRQNLSGEAGISTNCLLCYVLYSVLYLLALFGTFLELHNNTEC